MAIGASSRGKRRTESGDHAADLSVVIPAFNAAATIERTIASLLPLTDDICEIVVSDDGSTDDTAQRIEAIRQTLGVNCVSIHDRNKGPGAARNRAVPLLTGQWVLFLDADDTVIADGLLDLLNLARRSPAAHAVIGGRINVLPDGGERSILPNAAIQDTRTVSDMLVAFLRRQGPSIQLGSVLTRRSILPSQSFPTTRVAEDLAFLTRLLAGGQCVFRDVEAVRYHIDPIRQLAREATYPEDLLRSAAFAIDGIAGAVEQGRSLDRLANAVAHLTAMRAFAKTGNVQAARHQWRIAFALDRRQALRWVNMKRLIGWRRIFSSASQS